MRWNRLADTIYGSGNYRITLLSINHLVDATLYYRGVQVMTTRGSKTRVLADCKAIAEHHARPYRQCPSIGCTSHADITRDSFDDSGCAICDHEDVSAAHWDTSTGTTLVAWSCAHHSDELDGLRIDDMLGVDLINAHRKARKP